MQIPLVRALGPLLLLAALPLGAQAAPGGATPAPRAGTWKSDPVWYDGLAEKCVYRARRTIYGVPRHYEAIAYTNKQRQDPETTVKSLDDAGLLVFKHHWSERAPTESYDYDFSTAVFVEHDSLAPFKLAVGTQEDCGASYKQIVRAARGYDWLEAVYHPGGGLRQGSLAPRENLGFEDALTLTLRDFPFESSKTQTLWVVPSQKSPKRVSFEPFELRVSYTGIEEIDLPIGRLRTHRLVCTRDGEPHSDYWFAAEGSAPLLHVLALYEGPDGVVYELQSHTRTAYWER